MACVRCEGFYQAGVVGDSTGAYLAVAAGQFSNLSRYLRQFLLKALCWPSQLAHFGTGLFHGLQRTGSILWT